MKLQLIAVGNKMPDWVNVAILEYQKRFANNYQLNIKCLPMAKRGKSYNANLAIEQESIAIVNEIKLNQKNNYNISLDLAGENWSTEKLAKNLQNWSERFQQINFVIGGPDGMSRECLESCNQSWSLSQLTLPHPLVRIIVIEQLYRAWSIIHKHPYHK